MRVVATQRLQGRQHHQAPAPGDALQQRVLLRGAQVGRDQEVHVQQHHHLRVRDANVSHRLDFGATSGDPRENRIQA